jgi:ABC-type transport system involved in multi-copper enzyme maturation permease subunit
VNSIRAEFLKLVTTKMWWILLIVLLAYVAFTSAILAGAFSGGLPGGSGGTGQGTPQLPADALPPIIYSIAHSIGYVFPLLLGTLAVTGEFRHQTLTPTFLATPKRGRVLAAKLVVIALFGALYGIVAVVGAVGAGGAVLSLGGGVTGLDDGDQWLMFGRIVLAMALWAVIGVGVGALIPNQVAAIVVVLAFTQFMEPILRTVSAFVDWAAEVGNYLPGAAGDTLIGASIFTALGMSAGEAPALEWWHGGLLLLAYALVATVVGYAVSWRRDVT